MSLVADKRVRILCIVALFGLTTALLSFGLGRLALLDPDEARYAQSSREMLERGDYAVPYFNGEMRLKKPPLLHWAQIATFKLFGVGEIGARLPSVAASLGLLAVLLIFASRHCGWGVALRAGAILATCPLVFVVGRAGIIDMALCLFIAAALFVYYAVESARIRPRPGAILVGALLGGAVLAKGPVGFLAPLAVIVAHHALMREWRAFLRWRGFLLGAATMTAVVGPWLLLVIHRVGYETFVGVVLRETVERYASSGLEHPHGPFFYVIVMALVAFPWSAFLAPCSVTGAFRYARPGDRLGTFLWSWMAAMLVFFSLSKGKLATYVLPVLPAAALYLAREWEGWTSTDRSDAARVQRTNAEWGISLALLVPAFALAFLIASYDVVHGSSFWRHWLSFSAASGAILAAGLGLSARRCRWGVVPIIAATLAAFFFYAMSVALPEIDRTKSLRQMVRELRLDERSDTSLCVYLNFHPSLVFYTGRHVERADNRPQLEAFLKQPGEAVVVMDVRRHATLGDRWDQVFRQIGSQADQLALEKRPGVTPDLIDRLRAESKQKRHGKPPRRSPEE
jgi:4-amino-4-deoxy-L-arabinose transferase-like glycosyltransferase